MSNKPKASRTGLKTPDATKHEKKKSAASDNKQPPAKSMKSTKLTQPAKSAKTARSAQSVKSAKPDDPMKQAGSAKGTKPAATAPTEPSAKTAKQPQPAKTKAAARSSKGAGSPETSKKTKAAETTKKPSGKTRSSRKTIEGNERSKNKTPQVLKLLEQDKSASNPVILAGKSRIPRMLSGREPLSKIMRREMGEIFSDIDDTVVVNLTQLAIEYEAPEILDRFNACSCDKCVEIFSCAIAKRVPARFARVTKGADLRTGGRGSRELMERMDPVRKKVITEMIKELIGNKRRCFHDDPENNKNDN